MGVKQFKVEFENPSRCFFPGQMVSGKVTLDVNKKKEIKGLWVKFEGRATVSWTETGLESGKRSSQKNRSRKIVFRDIEPYFSTEVTLLGRYSLSDVVSGSAGNSTVEIPAGKTICPFGFVLPQGIPSSYVGKAGQVYYSAEVVLKTGNGKSFVKQRFPFSVNGILDLNAQPGISEEMEVRNYKSVCCFCCRSGPVGFLFKLPKKGYVPGEPIRFAVEINNQSTRKIKGITLSLVQIVNFHAKGNTFTDTRTIRKIRGPEVDKGDAENWVRDYLQIPPVPPTKLASCRIIDLRYTLNIDMEVNGTSKMSSELPIVIGTIPLRSTFPILRVPPPPPQSVMSPALPTSSTKEEEAALTAPPPPPPFLLNYPDLPPPTYEQAMSIETASSGVVNASFKSGQNDTGDMELDEMADLFRIDETFVPRYITYAWAGI